MVPGAAHKWNLHTRHLKSCVKTQPLIVLADGICWTLLTATNSIHESSSSTPPSTPVLRVLLVFASGPLPCRPSETTLPFSGPPIIPVLNLSGEWTVSPRLVSGGCDSYPWMWAFIRERELGRQTGDIQSLDTVFFFLIPHNCFHLEVRCMKGGPCLICNMNMQHLDRLVVLAGRLACSDKAVKRCDQVRSEAGKDVRTTKKPIRWQTNHVHGHHYTEEYNIRSCVV
ncbi:hypothetical protein QBC45DRAFT_413034 [Copromyces sp. CBS 386.78]|nr:hypothetical protein QBC45DRAFT_413034 [Copromyces sp. CBS 386.78]